MGRLYRVRLLRVRQGDNVHIHPVNGVEIAHGIDIHAAALAPSRHFAPIPGRTDLSYDFEAKFPGLHLPLQRGTDGYACCQRDVWNDDHRCADRIELKRL